MTFIQTERCVDMPQDARRVVSQILEDAGLTTQQMGQVMRTPLTMIKLGDARFPDDMIAAARADPKGLEYAYDFAGKIHPPVILIGPDWLADGKLRCLAARMCHRGWVEAVDLREAMPGLPVPNKCGWALKPELRAAKKPPGPVVTLLPARSA